MVDRDNQYYRVVGVCFCYRIVAVGTSRSHHVHLCSISEAMETEGKHLQRTGCICIPAAAFRSVHDHVSVISTFLSRVVGNRLYSTTALCLVGTGESHLG